MIKSLIVLSLLLGGHPLLALAVLAVILLAFDGMTFRLTPSLFAFARKRMERRRLTRAVSVNPHDADARMELGRLLAEMGRHAEAASQMEQAIRKLDDVAEAHLLLGTTLLRSGRPADACVPLARSLEIDPAVRMGEARLRLGECLLATGERSGAREAFEAYLAGHESSLEGRILAARERELSGDPAAARRHLEAALAAHAAAPRFRRRQDRLRAWRARALLRGLPLRP